MAGKSDSGEAQREGRRSYSAPALEKGIEIVELLASAPNGLTISEIAQGLARSIGEVFRIVIVMESRRWLQKDRGTDRYSVTYRVLDAAFRATPAQSLTLIAAPAMRDLAQAINQSCHLVVVGEGRGLVVQRQESPGQVGFGIRLGVNVDLATSCSGHVLLAFASEERLATLLPSLPLPNGYTKAQLRQRLEVVRVQGYEMQPSARTIGVTDISYPVFGYDGQVAAALTVPFLMMIDDSHQIGLEGTRELLRDAAAQISVGLGWIAPEPKAE